MRVTARARTYSVWYRMNGGPRRFTLGPADEITLADARERALEIRAQALAPRTLDEYRRLLKADVLPALGGIAPAEVTKAHVRAVVDSIRAEGHTVHANRVPAVLKSVFSWQFS